MGMSFKIVKNIMGKKVDQDTFKAWTGHRNRGGSWLGAWTDEEGDVWKLTIDIINHIESSNVEDLEKEVRKILIMCRNDKDNEISKIVIAAIMAETRFMKLGAPLPLFDTIDEFSIWRNIPEAERVLNGKPLTLRFICSDRNGELMGSIKESRTIKLKTWFDREEVVHFNHRLTIR